MTAKDIRVLVIEEDDFARNWISMLLARDWRTQACAEFAEIDEAAIYLQKSQTRIDMILLDADLINAQNILKLSESLQSRNHTRLFTLGNYKKPEILNIVTSDLFHGYVLKSEIGDSLTWAIEFAFDGQWVTTPKIQNCIFEQGGRLPTKSIVLDGRHTIHNFTDHEAKVARMALIFSMERRDLSNELGISEDWGYGLVSMLYKKLGIDEMLSGEIAPESYLIGHPVLLEHLQNIIQQLGKSKKAKDMEALAFHLLTIPEIVN